MYQLIQSVLEVCLSKYKMKRNTITRNLIINLKKLKFSFSTIAEFESIRLIYCQLCILYSMEVDALLLGRRYREYLFLGGFLAKARPHVVPFGGPSLLFLVRSLIKDH